MKSLFTAGVLLTALALPAAFISCAPIVPYSDQEMPQQITLGDPWLRGKLRVTVFPPSHIAGGQLKVNLEVRNVTGEDLSLDYSAQFIDERGAPTGIAENAHHFYVHPYDRTAIELTSTGPEARDFKLQIKKAQ